MSKKKCLYCGKHTEKNKTYCNMECKKKYDEFEKYTSKKIGLFGILIGIAIFLIFAGMALLGFSKTLGIGVIIFGACGCFLLLAIFPFATPETVKAIGVKKSIIIVRVIGIVCAIGTAIAGVVGLSK